MVYLYKMYRIILILLLTVGFLPGTSQDIRGLYVNKTDIILGDPVAERALCTYINECRFNHVLLYSLSKINFRDPQRINQLRSFLRRLRTECRVNKIGAVGENFEFFLDKIHTYNLDPETDPIEQFDVYNMEFEFWSDSGVAGYYCDQYLKPAGFPCTEEGAFDYVKKTLIALRAMRADIPRLETEIYIGWIKPGQAAQLPSLVDRILPAVYIAARPDGTIELYNTSSQRQRLKDLAAGGPFNLLPIFNGEKDSYDSNLYPWLISGHTLCEPWFNYLSGFQRETDPSILANIHLVGYQWFKYTEMPPVPSLLPSPGPVEGTRYPEILFPHLFRIPVQAEADEIRWTQASTGEVTIYSSDETIHPVTFTQPGRDTLFVQTFKCGAKSKIYQVETEVRAIGTGIEETDDGRRKTDYGSLETGVWSQGIITYSSENGIGINFIKPLPVTLNLRIMDAYGRLVEIREVHAGFSGIIDIPAGNGLYLVSLTAGKETFTVKVVR